MDEKELRKTAMEIIKEQLGLTNTLDDNDSLKYLAGFTDGVITLVDELLAGQKERCKG